MIFNMTSGSVAAGLNFKVVGGASEPTNPSENTIWVNTDTEITSWTFSTTEPEASSEGMVWIITGKSSSVDFNALKKNNITVYPIFAKQCVDGSWVGVQCMSYQNGAFVKWIPAGALYYEGNECVDTSGGWQARGWAMSSTNKTTVEPTITNNDDHMQISVPSSGVACGAVEVINDQDLTSVNSITIDFEMTIASYYVMLLVIDRNTSYMDNSVCSIKLDDAHTGTFSRRTITLDTSSVSGLYDVAIRFSDYWKGGGSSVDMKVYSVIME